MQDIRSARFVATNFVQLQGLRILPIGFCVILVSIWSILQIDHRQTVVIPIIILGVSALAYWRVDRFYAHNYGRVKQTSRLRWKEITLMIVGGILGLASFWVDNTFRPPVSVVGLVFVAAMLTDYFRVNWRDDWREFWFYPASALLILVTDLLPVLVGPAFWPSLGIRSKLVGTFLVVGVLSIPLGVLSHRYFLSILPPSRDIQP
jgi:uncharacterized membrane protein